MRRQSHHFPMPGKSRLRSMPALRIAVFMALASTVIVGCKKKPGAAAAPPPMPVAAMEVVVRDQPVYAEQIGQTRGSTEVEIRARVQGFLESVNFEQGRLVNKGDLLYTIDPKPYEASLAQAKGVLAQAEAALSKAQLDVNRYKPLIEKNAISRQQFDDALNAARAQEANVQSAKAGVQSAEIQLGYTKIYAPTDGLVGKTEVQPGNLVGSGSPTLLTTISDTDPIRVRFSVSEREYLAFAKANPDMARREAEGRNALFELLLADGSVWPHKGGVVFADRAIDPTTGTLSVDVDFPNPQKILRPGQYARVRVPSQIITNAVLVPQRAVSQLQSVYSVVVVSADNKAEFRPVQVGARVDSWWVVTSGLRAGEKVVVEGLQKIRPGASVAPTITKPDDIPALAPERN